MSTTLVSLYLRTISKIKEFLRQERGDQMTSTIVLMIVVVVVGGLLMAALRIFFPSIWQQITTNITNLWNP